MGSGNGNNSRLSNVDGSGSGTTVSIGDVVRVRSRHKPRNRPCSGVVRCSTRSNNLNNGGTTVACNGVQYVDGSSELSRFINGNGGRSGTVVGIGDGIGHVSSSDIGKGTRSGVRTSSSCSNNIHRSGLSVAKNRGSNGSSNVEKRKGTNAL